MAAKAAAKIKARSRQRKRQTPAEAMHGVHWVKQKWEAARGILKKRGPKNPVAWQRRLRREWEQ